MGLYEVYTEFLIVDKSTEFNGKETERKSWELWFLIYIFLSYFCLAVITHDSVQFHCQFNHLSFPESPSHIPWIIIHSFILLLVDKGPKGSRAAAARRVEPFIHRVSINSGSLHLSRAVCEVDVLLAWSFCGFLRMTSSNVYMACSTATSEPHHHHHHHQNHRSISPHKLRSVLLWSSSPCLWPNV